MTHSGTATPRLISHTDRARMRRFLDACEERLTRERLEIEKLRTRVESFVAVPREELPGDVATMHAQVRLRDLASGRTLACTVVLPPDAAVAMHGRSPLAWPGSVLLGAREGDEFQWPLPAGMRHMRLERVIFQPEPVQLNQLVQARRRRLGGNHRGRDHRAGERKAIIHKPSFVENHQASGAAQASRAE